MEKKTTLIIVGLLVLAVAAGTSKCIVEDLTPIRESPGDVNITITAGQDVDWSQNFYELNFGGVNRCDTANSEGMGHALEVINNGLTPVNVRIRYTTDLFTDPGSSWNFKAECYAINPISGNLYAFAGNCWDGVAGMQDTYTPITSSDRNVITCLNYRASDATTKPGVRIDNELVVSCSEPLGAAYGVVGLTFETADVAIDCGGDSGYDPGG